MSKSSHQVEKLAKFLAYAVGRRPDEFGLLADPQGFITIKELLQALHEEQGWRHIRQVHLNEVVATLANPPVQIEGNRIRTIDRSGLPAATDPGQIPKLLYLAIRQRAYPAALQKGLMPGASPWLVLSIDPNMALRIGRRSDNQPTLLTVQVAHSLEKGTRYQQYGRHLFLADKIMVGTFSGPPLPKEKSGTTTKPVPSPSAPLSPGSYFPDPDAFKPSSPHRVPGSKHHEPDWKKARRQARRYKERRNDQK